MLTISFQVVCVDLDFIRHPVESVRLSVTIHLWRTVVTVGLLARPVMTVGLLLVITKRFSHLSLTVGLPVVVTVYLALFCGGGLLLMWVVVTVCLLMTVGGWLVMAAGVEITS